MSILRHEMGGDFTRGSDTTATHLQLLRKACLYLLLVGAVATPTATVWQATEMLSKDQWAWLWRSWLAHRVCGFPRDPGCSREFSLPFEDGTRDLTALQVVELVHNPLVQEFLGGAKEQLFQAFDFGLLLGFVTSTATAGFFVFKGWRLRRIVHLHGLRLVPEWLLSWKLILVRRASSHVIGGYVFGMPFLSGVPLLRGTETLHVVIVGATGGGKTQLLHQQLAIARRVGERAACYDDGGILLSHHYRHGDHIMNPFDSRSVRWTPFAEIHDESDCRAIMESLFPLTERTSDPIWVNSARLWGTDILWTLYRRGDHSNRAVYELMRARIDELVNHLAGTVTSSQMAVDRTAESIRAELLSRAEIFRFLPDPLTDQRVFSIRHWALQPDGWLFFPIPERLQSLLKPLLSLWIDQLCLSLLSRQPDIPGTCTWVILDEVGSLQRLPALERLLMKGRKFNAAVVLGLQTFAALRAVYGHDAAINMLGNCHTRLVFPLTDPETASEASKLFGHVSTLEPEESLSMGPHAIRDGMTLSYREMRRPLIPPEEFMGMRRLTAFVRLPEDTPATRIKIRYRKWPGVAEAFVPRVARNEPPDSESPPRATKPVSPSEPQADNPRGLAQLADELTRELR